MELHLPHGLKSRKKHGIGINADRPGGGGGARGPLATLGIMNSRAVTTTTPLKHPPNPE